LGRDEINTVLIQIGLTFGFVEFKLIHEYKLFLFYSTRKIWKKAVAANAEAQRRPVKGGRWP